MSIRPMVLIVDNDGANRDLLRWMLRADYEILESENIRQASAILEQSREHEAISLILLGLDVPEKDVMSLLSECAEDSLLSLIPVLITLKGDIFNTAGHYFESGISDYILFPYEPVIVRRKVFNLVSLRTADALVGKMAYDELTGLYSGEIFYREARTMLNDNPDTPYLLICSDFENFKLMGKLFGAAICDELLRAFSEQLSGFGGNGSLCGRLSLDHLALLLPEPSELCLPDFDSHPLGRCVSLRYGIYPVEQRDLPVRDMCECALAAARSFSGSHGTHCVRYDRVFHQKYVRDQAIAMELDSALESGQFKLYYQPKINLRNGKTCGAEALVRWDHPQRGLLPAGEFLPLFARSGLIHKLDRYVFERNCANMQNWICKGVCIVPTSVNVSRASLYDPDIPKSFAATARAHGLSPQNIYIAINEAAYSDDPKQLLDASNQLKRDGFMIEMDGFGTGYSSLHMLSQLPIDILNVNMDFIRQDFNRESKNIFGFIISLAKWMDLRVTVACVEDASWLDALKSIDCNYAQGYYYARPMPEDAYEKFLRETELDLSENNAGIRSDEIVLSPAGRAKGKRTMLVADDSSLSRTVLSRIFSEDFNIAEVSNGAAALGYLEEHHNDVSIVLLDLIMPVMDGFETLEHIRSSPDYRNLPVIVIAQPGDASERKALGLGADDFIAKPFDDGIVMRRVLNVIDSATLREQRRQIEHKHAILQEAFVDYLTGAYNRRGLEGAWERLPNVCNGLYALFMIDLDNFKQCNDRFGHDYGDEVLKFFCAQLRMFLRGSDLVARIGGDEFLVLLSNMNSAESALLKGEQLCATLAEQMNAANMPVTCSMGVTVFDVIPRDMDEVLQRADKAMYKAKQSGKNNCFLWDSEMK